MKSFPQAYKHSTTMRRGPQSASKTELIHREIAIMKRLDHPNLVKLQEVIEDIGEGNKLYIILEYVDGGMILTSIDNSDPSLSPKFIAPRGVQGKYTEQQASRLFRSESIAVPFSPSHDSLSLCLSLQTNHQWNALSSWK
jgi:serine/threonine protein kinase